MPIRPSACCAALLTLLLWSGCRDREITAYRAPKDPAAVIPPAGMTNTNDLPPGHPPIGGETTPAVSDGTMANTAVPTGSDNLTWTAPARWIAQGPKPMRKATYLLGGDNGATAELSITAFPGDVGGLLANVNRWRGQLGLAPLDESSLPSQTVPLAVGRLALTVTDFSGTAGGKPTRLLGAILPYEGETWFFKLTGPEALLAREKPAFLDFLKTVTPRQP